MDKKYILFSILLLFVISMTVSAEYYNVPIKLGAHVVQNITLIPTDNAPSTILTNYPINNSPLKITQIDITHYVVSNPTDNVVSGYISIYDEDWDNYVETNIGQVDYKPTIAYDYGTYYTVNDLISRNLINDLFRRFPFIIPIFAIFIQTAVYIKERKYGYWKSLITVILFFAIMEIISKGSVNNSLMNAPYLFGAWALMNVIFLGNMYLNTNRTSNNIKW